MPDAGKQSGIALEKAYQLLLWLVPTVEKFPRSQKFLLGDRMQFGHDDRGARLSS